MKTFKDLLVTVIITLIVVALLLTRLAFYLNSLDSTSVTDINTTSGILALFFGFGIAMGGAMMNDSGSGGFFTKLFQVSTITYPLVYLIGLVSSISLLYSDMENKQEIARWLASMSLFQLSFIIVLFAVGLVYENYKDFQRDKRRGR